MPKITSAKNLKSAIIALERRQTVEEQLLREQFTATYESLKPINVLRKAINDFLTPSELKEPIFETMGGILAGYLSRILITRNSNNPLRRLTGVLVQYGITNIISKNSKAILRLCLSWLQRLSGSSKSDKN